VSAVRRHIAPPYNPHDELKNTIKIFSKMGPENHFEVGDLRFLGPILENILMAFLRSLQLQVGGL
jgi:hypothetical protein